jgi:GYF domain
VKRQQQQQLQQQQQQPPKQVSHVKPIIPQYGPDEANLKKQAAKNEQNKDQQQINILPHILGAKNQGEKWPEKLVNEVVKDEANGNSSTGSTKEAFWFYLDPQGFEQGKFSSEQMLAWTKSGFFPHNLQVRRASENFFSDICQFAAIWDQAKPAPEPTRTEVIDIVSQLNSMLIFHFVGTFVTLLGTRLECSNSN